MGLSLSSNDLSGVLLVGGSTRIPIVQSTVEKIFGMQPISTANVDEVVALGASVYAANKADQSLLNPAQKSSIEKINVQDVTPAYFGFICSQFHQKRKKYVPKVSIIIEKNTKLPCKASKSYMTTHDGQKSIKIQITQSTYKEKDPELVNILYETALELPDDRPANQRIDATFSYDLNQVMHVEFVDIASGRKIEKKLEIDPDLDDNLDDFVVE